MLLSAALEARLEWTAACRGLSVAELLDDVLSRYSAGVDATGVPSREAVLQAAVLIEDAGGEAVLPDGYRRGNDAARIRKALRGR